MIILKFIGWRIKRALKKRMAYKGMNQARNICFICNLDDQFGFDLLLRYSVDLKKRNKEVAVLVFFDGPEKNLKKGLADSTQALIISRTDFNVFAGIKRKEIQDLMNKPFDILCNFDTQKTPFTHLLSAQSMAKFKIGIDLHKTEIYDLLLEREENPSLEKYISDFKEVMNNVFSNQWSPA
jgi:hypothetical protein